MPMLREMVASVFYEMCDEGLKEMYGPSKETFLKYLSKKAGKFVERRVRSNYLLECGPKALEGNRI